MNDMTEVNIDMVSNGIIHSVRLRSYHGVRNVSFPKYFAYAQNVQNE